MQHQVAHSVPPGWLIRDWREARELWQRLLALGPARSIAIMPDHVHRVARSAEPEAWQGMMSGYARWRNHHRGEAGRCVWLPAPPPEEVRDAKHLRRTDRYVHLNPCRDRLVSDPLAWPFTTHRDAVGLALPCVVQPQRDPIRYHARISGDPSVAVCGTDLPYARHGDRPPTVDEMEAAVSALTRTPLDDLRRRGPARVLFIQALVALTPMSQRAVAREVGVSPACVNQTPPGDHAALAVIERVLGDPRFSSLWDQDLTTLPAWRRYHEVRVRHGSYDRLIRAALPRLARRAKAKRPFDL